MGWFTWKRSFGLPWASNSIITDSTYNNNLVFFVITVRWRRYLYSGSWFTLFQVFQVCIQTHFQLNIQKLNNFPKTFIHTIHTNTHPYTHRTLYIQSEIQTHNIKWRGLIKTQLTLTNTCLPWSMLHVTTPSDYDILCRFRALFIFYSYPFSFRKHFTVIFQHNKQ